MLKDPKKREAYYTKHKTEIEAFKDARDYLNAVMNGRTDPVPIKDWRAEQTKLTAAKYALCERYYALQDEVRSVEQLRKRARRISCVTKRGTRLRADTVLIYLDPAGATDRFTACPLPSRPK